MKRQMILRSMLLAELILLLPLIAMQFTDEVNWSLSDFIIASILLAGIGFSCYVVINGMKKSFTQTLVGILLVIAVLLIWMELAVGIFGTPFAGS